jgi:hypothetical protein
VEAPLPDQEFGVFSFPELKFCGRPLPDIHGGIWPNRSSGELKFRFGGLGYGLWGLGLGVLVFRVWNGGVSLRFRFLCVLCVWPKS